MARFVVGITGASGVRLAFLAINELLALGHNIELILSRDAPQSILHEMGEDYSSPQKFLAAFLPKYQTQLRLHQYQDFNAPVASGSFKHDGCLVIPCSMATLSAIACGLADNLLRRACDVTLKEKRKLVLVPREAPISEIHLENMLKLARMGVVIFPPELAWYMKPKTLEEAEHFLISRILDQLGVDIGEKRWGD